MRSVNVYEFIYNPNIKKTEKLLVGTGSFHGFGIDYEECNRGAGSFSTAIIEMPDGTVKNVSLDMIKFVKED